MTSVFSWLSSISLCPVSFCTPRPNLPVSPAWRWSGCEEIPHIQGQRNPNKMVGGANSHLESNPIPPRDTQRAQTNLVHTRTQRPHRDWDRTVFECLLRRYRSAVEVIVLSKMHDLIYTKKSKKVEYIAADCRTVVTSGGQVGKTGRLSSKSTELQLYRASKSRDLTYRSYSTLSTVNTTVLFTGNVPRE